jgi:hypothetical protein
MMADVNKTANLSTFLHSKSVALLTFSGHSSKNGTFRVSFRTIATTATATFLKEKDRLHQYIVGVIQAS